MKFDVDNFNRLFVKAVLLIVNLIDYFANKDAKEDVIEYGEIAQPLIQQVEADLA